MTYEEGSTRRRKGAKTQNELSFLVRIVRRARSSVFSIDLPALKRGELSREDLERRRLAKGRIFAALLALKREGKL